MPTMNGTTHRVQQSDLKGRPFANASAQERRGIQKEVNAAPALWNKTIRRWTDEVHREACAFGDIVHRPTSTAHNWRYAYAYLRIALTQRGANRLTENRLKQMELSLLPAIIADYKGYAAAADLFWYSFGHPNDAFFNGMLCFCAHYAKHGHPKSMSVEDYLKKMNDVLTNPTKQFVQNGCPTKEKGRWIVISEPNNAYVRTAYKI
ncbi:hypothetical protein QR680_012242 [Steinernema hermaphroditum]|uniref:Uncharacterized protein n=1 Tax=Steinernema hermaphroditum TaxID=289476 RepID=A0AA39I1E3_9BILA|nr:hypothetical protein QR680_012242 [Steinernema hermaphroditum]